MALGTTDITTTAVGNAIGNISRNVGVLCTSTTINKWSKNRPGYLTIVTQELAYQAPRGGAYTDPRGTDSESGTDKEGYKLGDFRGYNHSAQIPYCDFVSGIIRYAYGTTTATPSRTFYVGEVDWKQASPLYRQTNIWADLENVHLLDIDNSYAILGSAAIPAENGNVSIPLSISIPTAGVTVTKNIQIGMGIDSTHTSFRLGNVYSAVGIGSVSVHQNTQQEDITLALFQYLVWDGTTSITGADDTTDAIIINVSSKGFNSNTQLFAVLGASAIETSYLGANIHHYRNVTGTGYMRGFNGTTTEYLMGTVTLNYNTTETFDLPATAPHTPTVEGDILEIIIYNPAVSIKID